MSALLVLAWIGISIRLVMEFREFDRDLAAEEAALEQRGSAA